VQIGLVRIRGGKCVGQFNEFMNPEHKLSQWSKENLLNSEGKELTDAWLQDQPPWNEVLERALEFIDDCPIVGGQNCQFDIGVMLHSLRRKKKDGTAIGESRWKVKGHVDSLYITQVIMAQAIAAHQPIVLPDNYKLKTLHEHFGRGPFLAHDAAADSLASWCVMCAALDRHRDMQLLSQEQAQFLEQALQGNSMFITGGAGTGKSFLLRIIVEVMKMRGKHCAVLSPTGVASLNVKGATINSFFGIGIPIKWHDFINIQKPEKNRNLTLLTQQDTQDSHKTNITIVLDEISMVSAEMLDLIDANVRAAREEPGKPFGGLQILMFGDFFQLPPVVTQSNGDLQHPLTNGDLQHPFTNAGFAFESHFWNELQPHFCSLQKSYRQEDKSPFFEALNRIRVGELNEDDKKMLTQPKSAPSTALVPATKLFSLTHGVQHANDIELQKLPGTEVKFRATDTPGVPKNMQPPAELRLKIGARVMLVKNLDPSRGLVNGACGTVVDFLPLRTPTLPFPHPAPSPIPCKLYVSNINVDTTSKSLEEVFAPCVHRLASPRWS
jgi:DNA polymerase III epsilon subunit-like protein